MRIIFDIANLLLKIREKLNTFMTIFVEGKKYYILDAKLVTLKRVNPLGQLNVHEFGELLNLKLKCENHLNKQTWYFQKWQKFKLF